MNIERECRPFRAIRTRTDPSAEHGHSSRRRGRQTDKQTEEEGGKMKREDSCIELKENEVEEEEILFFKKNSEKIEKKAPFQKDS